jgi:hypothetical protein
MSKMPRVNGRRALRGPLYDPFRSPLFVLREHPKSFDAAYQGDGPPPYGDGSMESLII